MIQFMNRFWQEEEGQDLVDFSAVAFIALAAVTILGTVQKNIIDWTCMLTPV